MIWADKPKNILKIQFICRFPPNCCGILQSSRLCCCEIKPLVLFELLFTEKALLDGHAIKQNYVFVIFQPEATKKNSQD